MKTKSFINFIFIIFLFGISTSVFGCSAFLMKGKGYSLIGFNENWKSMPGMIVINKRGVVKRNLSWNYLVSKEKPSEPEFSWTSKYGSVSFNLLGLDMPCYGLNEKGLFIVELYLDKTYSQSDSMKPKMFWAQWIQYQLDNYSTVDEVIKGLNHTPVIDWWPTFPGSHFFVSDRKGNTAAVELIDGKFQVSVGETMPVPVLCNGKYQSELAKMKTFRPFGGGDTLNMDSRKWENRFSKAAYYINNFDPGKEKNHLGYAFNVLDSIRPGQWQLVADIKNNIVYFRTDLAKSVKSINLLNCDFSKEAKIKFIDANSDKQGDVFADLTDLTVEINDGYVIKGFPVGYENQKFYSSDEYTYLKNNLHSYVADKLKNRH
jgi:penicillin V acylase-like amidase (Ntn superfamily)